MDLGLWETFREKLDTNEAGRVKRSGVKKVAEQLEQTGTPFLGVILNKYDVATEKYGAYGNYGNYGNYGKKA